MIHTHSFYFHLTSTPRPFIFLLIVVKCLAHSKERDRRLKMKKYPNRILDIKSVNNRRLLAQFLTATEARGSHIGVSRRLLDKLQDCRISDLLSRTVDGFCKGWGLLSEEPVKALEAGFRHRRYFSSAGQSPPPKQSPLFARQNIEKRFQIYLQWTVGGEHLCEVCEVWLFSVCLYVCVITMKIKYWRKISV